MNLKGLAIGLQTDSREMLAIFMAVMMHKAVMAFSLGLNIAQSNLSVSIMHSLLCIHYLLKSPQLWTWSSRGLNCRNGPHLVLILHKFLIFHFRKNCDRFWILPGEGFCVFQHHIQPCQPSWCCSRSVLQLIFSLNRNFSFRYWALWFASFHSSADLQWGSSGSTFFLNSSCPKLFDSSMKIAGHCWWDLSLHHIL